MKEDIEPDFFYFSKKERKGIFLLIILNCLIWLSPYIIKQFFIDNTNSFFSEINVKEFLSEDVDTKTMKINTNENPKSTKSLHYFDPNLIDQEEWQSFGVSEKTSATIIKYVSKGGRFKTAKDLNKIWGMPSALVTKLIRYVIIKDSFNDHHASNISLSVHKKSTPLININEADSATFEKLYGIGPKLSQRIILFRKKLGGFYDIHQVSEVWGLQDSVFQNIKEQFIISSINLVKININKAPLEQLQSHPYIGYKQGKMIINYRNQHGSFEKLEDIQKIISIDKETYSKIEHYLTIE